MKSFFLGQAALSLGPSTQVAADQLAYHLEVHRFVTNSEFWLQYDDIGAAFQSPLGYIPYVDIRSIYGHGNGTWFTPWKGKFLPKIDVAYDEQWWWSHDGKKKRENRYVTLNPYLVDALAITLYGQMDYYQGFENLLGIHRVLAKVSYSY
jgi:hypothetical protein